MEMERSDRGDQLFAGGRRIHSDPGLLARIFSIGADRLLDKVDAALNRGSLRVTLPDGSSRRLGGRASGFDAEISIHDWRALVRLSTAGSVGCYQAWEAGEWSSKDPVAFFAVIGANSRALGDIGRARGPWRWASRMLHRFNRNTRAQAERNIHAHYDLGNDFYGAWLDPTMSYSSGYRYGDDGLEASQHRKWEHLSKRLGTPETLLEIGCGWGSLANHFASRGSKVTCLSLSDEQLAWARSQYGSGIDFRHQDYRDVTGQFDAIVSVEMVEAVGREYWPTFFECLSRCLKRGGKAAIQFIAMRDDLFDAYANSADFIQAYIFPGGLLIRTSEFRRLAEEHGLSWDDEEDFGMDYAETLKAWRLNFTDAVAEGRLPAGFDARFIRLWQFYLMYCEGGFRGGGITVSQATLTKK
jgi:cyclopropane-fatty-acyl-phospholipid synthase